MLRREGLKTSCKAVVATLAAALLAAIIVIVVLALQLAGNDANHAPTPYHLLPQSHHALMPTPSTSSTAANYGTTPGV